MRNKSNGRHKPETAEPAPDKNSFSLISDEKLIALYANLLRCRTVAPTRANGNSVAIRGREAGIVGVAIDLNAEDVLISPRCGWITRFGDEGAVGAILHGVSAAHNGTSERTAALKARPAGTNGNGAFPMQASPIHAALGTALANKTKKNGKVAVVFEDDDDPECWREALQAASTHALPMIFVSHKNGKIDKTGKKTRRATASDSAETPWFPSITVDSHDVVAVYRVANEAISRARLGRGPTLIECQPFRVQGNAPKRATNGYAQDAVLNMEHYLRGKGLFQPKVKSEILKGLNT